MLTQQQIAEQVGCAQSMVHYILKRERTPSTIMAEGLEEITAVCREAWLWPEYHWNPYIPLGNCINCYTCARRIKKMSGWVPILIKYLDQSKDPQAELLGAMQSVQRFMGIPDGAFIYYFGKMIDDSTITPLVTDRPMRITEKHFPFLFENLHANQKLLLPYIREQVPKHCVNERRLLQSLGIKSALCLQVGEYVQLIGALKFHAIFSEEQTKLHTYFLTELRKIFKKKETMSNIALYSDSSCRAECL